jgi:hypothetical protein
MSKDRLTQADFGMGLLAGLRLRGVSLLSDYDLPKLHEAFVAAYKSVEEYLGGQQAAFLHPDA